MPQTEHKVLAACLALPIYSEFYYTFLSEQNAEVGCRALVPFGNKQKLALVTNSKVGLVDSKHKLKSIIQILDDKPILSNDLISFLKWVADYYIQPLGEVVFLALPLYLKKGAPLKNTQQFAWYKQDKINIDELGLEKKAPKQHQILMALKDKGLTEAEAKAGFKNVRSTLRTLVSNGWVVEGKAEVFDQPDAKVNAFTLNKEQKEVAEKINASKSKFSVHLIDGITGSGKTEVYFDVMQQVINDGKQVLFMLPEIGLTNAFIKRTQQRFGAEIAVIHSAKTPWKRYVSWDQMKRGAAKILIATRSGIFSEFKNLGLIILDEEHDSSYRQEDGVYYHGRDCAVKRAQLLDIPIVMGSATPSIETLRNCREGVYQRYELNERAKKSQLATMRVLNTLDKPLQADCSPTLIKSISKHLEQKGQVILFLNRRGFAPILMCHNCGWRKTCDACDAQMSLHRSVNKMVCHRCASQHVIPKQCPDCSSTDIQHYGVGTQQLEEKIKQLFPATLVERIDRDSTRLKDEFDEKLAILQSGEPGIFIGTQMLAKGHDYAGITLVGILNMDQGLHSTQYRATERLAQTIIQVSGRAGRGENAGEVLFQTDFPEHEIMADLVAQDYRSIANKLLEERALFGLPPYIKVIMFRADGLSLDHADAILIQIKQCIERENFKDIQCVGPFPSYFKKQEGRFRSQMYSYSANQKQLRSTIKQKMPELLKLKKSTHTKWRVDVDPMDL